MSRLSRAVRRLGAFRRDQGGVSAVEFALIAPVLILLYFGLAELSQGMMAQRRVSHAASAIGDLVAQDEGVVTLADMDQVFAAGKSIVAPFTVTPLNMRVTSLTGDANALAKVDWSDADGTGLVKYNKGVTVTIPTGLISAAGENVVMAETTYLYTPTLGYVLKNGLTFSEKFYLRPRQVAKVVCTDCP